MMRRILFLAWAPFFSGAERALLLTLRSLARSRYDPHVLVGTDGQLAAEVRALGIPCDIVALKPLDRSKPLSSGLSVARVTAAAFRIRPAIIHANDMPSYQPGGYAARVLGIPSVTHLRFPDKAEGYRWFFRPGFSRAIFISNWFRALALDEAPDVFRNRSTVLYDAVEGPRVWSSEERQRQRQQLGLPADRTAVAITGQVAEVKGIWEFVAAADKLRQKDAVFVVLGDDLRTQGAIRRDMEAKVTALGLTDRFRFLGFRQNAPELVQAFDIIAAPSQVEPFGLASLEAMAVSRPVVASRVGGIPEVVRDGVDGLLVPARDPDSLAAAIARLIDSPDQRAAMGAQGRQRAADTFSIQVHGEALARIYESVLNTSYGVEAGEVA
jgi:L-malate glycosyltransferase